jgi:membrane fusion protein (multidrug efflux system)
LPLNGPNRSVIQEVQVDATPAEFARDAATADPPPKKGKGAVFGVLALLLIALIVGCVLYWLDARHYESTDDAFIDGHVSQVAPQIAGRVTAILVRDNQMVAAGQKLIDIDPRDMQVKLMQALAQQAQTDAQLQQTRATLAVRQTDLGQAEANIRVSDADLEQTQQDLARYRAINPRAITRQQLDNASAAMRSAMAKRDANRQAAAGMRAQIDVTRAQIGAAEAALRVDDANVANARLQLSYATVVAPAPGRITRRTVELGNYVTPGQALLAVVQPGFWVTANFKETQLTDMHPGQKVRVHVDAFAGHDLAGHVDSLQSGTGAVFSALPVENATGNYVKVTQRLPVKILFDDDVSGIALAPGMSVTPTVTVR